MANNKEVTFGMGPFGFFSLFTASFAIADYRRDMPVRRPDVAQETQGPSESLRRCLKNLHINARHGTSYKLISNNRSMCDELFYIHHRVQEKMVGLKQLEKDPAEAALQELNRFTRKMCRSAMIRNSFYMDWFLATLSDNALKCYIAPVVLGNFGLVGLVAGMTYLARA